MLERYVLRQSLAILNRVFREWVNVERRQSGLFKNRNGHMVTVGKKSEPDIGGWITKGPYIAQKIVIETKNTSFHPGRVYGKDRERFINQCNFISRVNEDGGVGFWINNPNNLYMILLPVLMHGAKVSLDEKYNVVVTRIKVS
jgi:hypothetical protein